MQKRTKKVLLFTLIMAMLTALASVSAFADSETTYSINCFAYNLTDSATAGTVYLETDIDSYEGSAAFGSATENTKVTINAVANPGYEFVEWRKDTPSSSESKLTADAEYTFDATERLWLYAVFQKVSSGLTEIDTINIIGITTPIAGELPDVSGITTDTEGVTLGIVQWQKRSNGVVLIPENGDKFEKGIEYMLYIAYSIDDGYETADQVTVTTPGFTPNSNGTERYSKWIGINYTVPSDEPVVITSAHAVINGAEAGATMGSATASTDDTTYTVYIKNWHDCDNVFEYSGDNVLPESDTFVGGKTYTVAVVFTPVGNAEFADPSVFDPTINGEEGMIGSGEGINGRCYFVTVTIPAPIYSINCNAYNLSGSETPGTVYLETDIDSYEGAAAFGYATENAEVRINAVAKPGYEFVEWRKSIPSDPEAKISVNAEYTFNATELVWLYAVFQILYGDINGDGSVGVSDVITALQMIASNDFSSLSDAQKTASDVNGDERIDVSDAIRILQHIANPSISLNPNA